MKKWEKRILGSSSPEEYVENSLKSGLPPSEKARLTRIWMESTGFTRDDILYARNRHPHWKRKKAEGAEQRSRRRLDLHDYSMGSPRSWDARLLAEFLELNGKDKAGRYLHKDWELASHFGVSIPSIQYLRRKYLAVRRIMGPRLRREKLLEYLGRSELSLRRAGS